MSTAETNPAPAASGGSSKITKAVAGAATIAVLAFGASQIARGTSSSTTSTQTPSAPAGAPAGAGMPDMGTPVTGATLSKLTSAATAKYPGTVERAMQLPNGSYVVHVVRSGGSGEVHVLIGKDFKVTGVDQGGPPAGAPPSGQAAPGQSSFSNQ